MCRERLTKVTLKCCFESVDHRPTKPLDLKQFRISFASEVSSISKARGKQQICPPVFSETRLGLPWPSGRLGKLPKRTARFPILSFQKQRNTPTVAGNGTQVNKNTEPNMKYGAHTKARNIERKKKTRSPLNV